MVWVDRIVEEIKQRFATEIAAKKPLKIRDEKTLSGRVHVGSLRGIVIHGLIAQVLKSQGIECEFTFELNDFDPMDELPRNLERRDEFKTYMGQPLYTVPSPGPGAKNYPAVFGEELKGVVEPLKLPISYYALTPHYHAGEFNDVIRTALDHAAQIRTIYREVSGSKKPEDWYPLQVICESCGKVGTTQVTGWDGEKVSYGCKKDLVQWAMGCGHVGSISPFDGSAKLPWKVEWPAKWKVFGVHIEGAGKDHGAAGGSRDIGRRITEEIFHYPEPFNIPYEFFNIGGKKMSASKGLGVSAKEVADLLPSNILKLLMIRKLPNQPIDFDPEGLTIPQLFDEHDRLADHAFKRHPESDADFSRTYELTQIDFAAKPKDLWHMRFSLIAFIAQMPHLDLVKEAEAMKGSALTNEEKDDLGERFAYAKRWLQAYAPAKFKFELTSTPPLEYFQAHPLSAEQKKVLKMLAERLEKLDWKGETVHETIHAVKEEWKIEPKDLFTPLYRMFLNRDDGPQMGWFLSTMEREKVLSFIDQVLG